MAFAELGVPIVMDNPSPTGGAFTAELQWQTVPPLQYDVLASTNLQDGNWVPLNQQPIPSVTQVGTWSLSSSNTTAFFRVSGRDQDAPMIMDRYPSTNGLGVGASAQLTVIFSDETGVDTNAFALVINGDNRLTNGSPGVTITSNTFSYTPGTNRWADYGGSAAITLGYGDILGNVATSHWTFMVELLPVITNALVHIQPPSGGSSNRARMLATDAARKHGVKFAEALTIISIASNHVVFSYSGTAHGLFVGAILINHDPTTFFYRSVLDLTDDPEQHLVTVGTTDIGLGDIVEDGTFSPEILLPTTEQQPVLLATDTLTLGIPFRFEQEVTLPPYTNKLDGTVALKITPTLNVVYSGSVRLSGTISDGQVTAILGEFEQQQTVRLSPKIEVYRDILNWHSPAIPTPPLSIPLGTIGAFIGPVPVWVSLDLEISAGFEVKCTAALVWQPTLVLQKTDHASVSWTQSTGLNCDYREETQSWIEGANGGFKLSAEMFGFARPKLAVKLYSAAGVYVDARIGPYVKAEYTIGDPQAQIGLYGRMDIGAGFTLYGWQDADLPSTQLFTYKLLLLRAYWPEIDEQAPAFTLQPADVTTTAGSLVTLDASASGNPQPTYQWFHNGSAVPFATKPEFRFTANYQSAGNYSAIAYNRLGTATSASAHVSVDPVGPGTFSDDFNRPNSVTVGNGWTTYGVPPMASYSITDNALRISKDYAANVDGQQKVVPLGFNHVKTRVRTSSTRSGSHVQCFFDNGQYRCSLNFHGSDLRISVNGVKVTSMTYTSDRWYDIEAIMRGGVVDLYVDGVLRLSNVAMEPLTSSPTIMLGCGGVFDPFTTDYDYVYAGLQ